MDLGLDVVECVRCIDAHIYGLACERLDQDVGPRRLPASATTHVLCNLMNGYDDDDKQQ